MTNYEKILEYLREHPNATNKDISEQTGISIDTVKVGISRLKDKGYLDVSGTGINREITVLKELPVHKNDYKKETIRFLIDSYKEDFEKSDNVTDRIELGKLILKLLEKL